MAGLKGKVLLTGASGFIGRYVAAELLKRGYAVHALTSSPDFRHDGITVHRVNLLDPAAVTDFFRKNSFESLIHLAWYAGKGCHGSPLNLDWAEATLRLARLFAQSGGQRFMGAGSCSEYEYKYGFLTEDLTPCSPETIYGISKNSAGRTLGAYFRDRNIDFKWARIFNLYGPGERAARLMPSVIDSCLKNEDVLVSDCLKYQDYLYVKDTASGIADLFESPLAGPVNICSSEPVRLRHIVNEIVRLTGFKGRVRWGAVPAAFGDPVVVGNSAKLRSAGWEPKYSLEEGLKETIQWRENQHV